MSSLLPQQIPPQNVKLVDASGKIDKNWWLFLYNIANQTIGQQVDVGQILILLENQIDADLVEPVADVYLPDIEMPTLFPPLDESLAMPDVLPQNRAQPEQSVTVGASPYTYTAVQIGNLLVQGGTVSAIELSRDGGTFRTTGLTQGFVPAATGDQVRITYSLLPTAFFFPD